ncbi:MAG: hypothetical protein SFX72_19755 [Isosphaeraceae bacterium]|nr:hypothetical protein [Isosphaeraceae bacterium]
MSSAIVFLVALGILFLVVLGLQGPRKLFSQLIDFGGHRAAFRRGMAIWRRSGWVLGVSLASTVVAWSTNQALLFMRPEGREDLAVLLKGSTLSQAALENGILAGVVPLRDVVQLGSIIPLLFLGAFIVFQHGSNNNSRIDQFRGRAHPSSGAWMTAAWLILALHGIYRCVCLIYLAGELPLGFGVVFEILLVPAVMLLSDALVLGWVLIGFRNATLAETDEVRFDFEEWLRILPAVATTCFFLLPSRYLSAFVTLSFSYVIAAWGTTTATPATVLTALRWALGPGIVAIQVLTLPALAAIGSSVWSKGSIRDMVRGSTSVLRGQGGRIVVAVALIGGLSAAGSSLTYFLLFAMPPQTWLLNAADSYSHLLTLPLGLMLTSLLVDFARLELPLSSGAPLSASARTSERSLTEVAR